MRPRLGQDDRAAGWLHRLVSGEVALAVLVVLAVGIRTSLEPARDNRVLVELAARRGDPIDDASNVGLRLRFVDADLGAAVLTAEPVGGGSYVAEGAVLSIRDRGNWRSRCAGQTPSTPLCAKLW